MRHLHARVTGEGRWLAMKKMWGLGVTATAQDAVAYRDLRADRDRGAARPTERPRGQDDGMEEPGAAANQRRTLAADALIASSYLAGTNTRRVRRALAALFGGAVGKDTGSRTWRKVKSDWDAWNARSLAEEPIVRLILDGTVVRDGLTARRPRLALGRARRARRRSEGAAHDQKHGRRKRRGLARRARRSHQARAAAARVPHRRWRAGLDKAIAAVWDGVPVQRRTVHKHRNLLAHAPERLHEEITADYNDMIYATTREEIEARRKAFIRKRRLKHRAVADSLEEAGVRLYAFTRLPPSQWRSARTTNAIERLHEEFKRRIKTQTVLPSADTAAMLFWALLASGQITCVRVHRLADPRHKAQRSAN